VYCAYEYVCLSVCVVCVCMIYDCVYVSVCDV